MEAFLADSAIALAAFGRIQDAVTALGPVQLRLSATQVTWASRRGFAFLWLPGRWLGSRGAPAVLSIAAARSIPSPRWKEVVEVSPGLWMHHLELATGEDVDGEVAAWLDEGRRNAS